jgi:Leucine-rich repeat (LRR) protein
MAETPGTVIISPTTIAEACEQILFSAKQRLKKLCAMNAPEIIIQNQIQIIHQREEELNKTDYMPENFAYHFAADAGFVMTGEALVHLSTLIPWEALDLEKCSITDKEIAQLRNFSNLRRLILDNCIKITDASLVHIFTLTHLEVLGLSACLVSDEGLRHLRELSHLQALDVSYCKEITGEGLVHLTALTELKELVMSGCSLTDATLGYVAGLSQLENLVLRDCAITGEGLVHLTALAELKVLHMSLPVR